MSLVIQLGLSGAQILLNLNRWTELLEATTLVSLPADHRASDVSI